MTAIDVVLQGVLGHWMTDREFVQTCKIQAPAKTHQTSLSVHVHHSDLHQKFGQPLALSFRYWLTAVM